jgi:hypothetical protein
MVYELGFFTSKPENKVISGRSKISAGRQKPLSVRIVVAWNYLIIFQLWR